MVDRLGADSAGNLLRFPGSRAASQKYVSQMRSIYGQTIVDDPDVALASDPDIYAKVMRDPVFATAILQRLHSVAGNEWFAESATDKPEDKAAAAIFEELLTYIKNFSQARFLLVPVIRGRTYGYCEGKRRKLVVDENKPMDWYIVNRIRDIDKRRIRIFTDNTPTENGRDIHLRMTIGEIGGYDWVDIPTWAQPALIRAVYQDREERLGMGEGLMTPIYYYFYAKGKVWQEGLQGLERWAQGIVSAKVNLEREGDTGVTNLQVAAEWIDVINEMRSRHALVYGEGDEFQVHETSGTGHQMVTDMLNYCDQAVYRLLTGSVRPGGMDTETGARAAAETEQDTSDILIQYDRGLLDEAFTQYLFKLLWNQNRAIFADLGLKKARMPRFKTAKERHEDPQAVATVVQTLLGAGVPLVKQEVYERAGFRMPAEEEEIFEGQKEQAPPGGGGGYPFDGRVSAAFAAPKRCPDGTIMPKSGDCSGLGA